MWNHEVLVETEIYGGHYKSKEKTEALEQTTEVTEPVKKWVDFSIKFEQISVHFIIYCVMDIVVVFVRPFTLWNYVEGIEHIFGELVSVQINAILGLYFLHLDLIHDFLSQVWLDGVPFQVRNMKDHLVMIIILRFKPFLVS